MKKTCTICGKKKELASKGAGKVRTYCKECDSTKSSERHCARKKAAREAQINKIGHKCCMICSSFENLKVDHCHATGAVRGLLCNECNFGIGFFKDDPDLLNKAIEYLKSKNNFGTYYKLNYWKNCA